jgi:plastocyanin
MNVFTFALCLLLWLALVTIPAWAADYTVQVGGATGDGLFFDPNVLTINVGDTVTWQHISGSHAHNVVVPGLFRCADGCDDTGGNGTPNSATWSFTRKFSDAGMVNYFCEVHQALGMTGSITVVASAPPPPASITIGPGFTGAWYDPNQTGHGLFIEVLKNNSLLAWWFTFSPDGAQSWFGGVGTYSGNTAVIDQGSVNQTLGGKWIPNFDPTKTTQVAWGKLTFTFTDCNSGRVDFTSTVPGYASGSMNLTRLTLPLGLSCP